MLDIYKVALELARAVGVQGGRIAVHDKDLARQMRRSMASVVLNIAEGAGCDGGTRRQRYKDALGSAQETKAALELGYLDACESAYLLFACPYFAFSERKRATRNKKYYPIDTGLRRMSVTRTGQDRGKMLECAVFLELRRLGADVSYWRGKGEVDSVVKTGDIIVPIQVSWDAPSDRHERALEEFYETFPHASEAEFIGPKEYEAGRLAMVVA